MRKARPKLTDICIADIREHLGREPRILIVDDEEDVTEMLEVAFAAVGYHVTREKCTNRAGTRILTAQEAYDAIVSDFNNKKASGDHEGGLTLYQKLQKKHSTPSIVCFHKWSERFIASC